MDKNKTVCFTKSFLSSSIYEIMFDSSKRPFIPSTNLKSKNMTLRDPTFFIPADLYKKISEIFLAFYDKKLDRNTFYTVITNLEKSKKIERIKIKKQIYYRLI